MTLPAVPSCITLDSIFRKPEDALPRNTELPKKAARCSFGDFCVSNRSSAIADFATRYAYLYRQPGSALCEGS